MDEYGLILDMTQRHAQINHGPVLDCLLGIFPTPHLGKRPCAQASTAGVPQMSTLLHTQTKGIEIDACETMRFLHVFRMLFP